MSLSLPLSIPSQQYAAQTRNFNFSVDPALTELDLSLTHPDWPTGECVRLNVDWDGGASSGACSISGGVVRDKNGNPTGGTMVTRWCCSKPPGVSGGTANMQIMQTITTAVLIEGF